MWAFLMITPYIFIINWKLWSAWLERRWRHWCAGNWAIQRSQFTMKNRRFCWVKLSQFHNWILQLQLESEWKPPAWTTLITCRYWGNIKRNHHCPSSPAPIIRALLMRWAPMSQISKWVTLFVDLLPLAPLPNSSSLISQNCSYFLLFLLFNNLSWNWDDFLIQFHLICFALSKVSSAKGMWFVGCCCTSCCIWNLTCCSCSSGPIGLRSGNIIPMNKKYHNIQFAKLTNLAIGANFLTKFVVKANYLSIIAC